MLHRFESPKAVFARIPKTGSTTVINGLFGGIDRVAEFSDQIQPGWEDLYSFCFVRNPFDRLASALCMFQRALKKDSPAESRLRSELSVSLLLDLVEDGYSDDYPWFSNQYGSIVPFFRKIRWHFRPLDDKHDLLASLDDWYRFENFEDDYRALASRLGVDPSTIPHFKQSSERRPYSDFFCQADKKRAEALYRADCEFFGYSFE